MNGSSPRWNRRQLLRAGAVTAAGTGIGWTAGATSAPATQQAAPGSGSGSDGGAGGSGISLGNRTVPFHAVHQAGISTPQPAVLTLLGLNLRKGVERAELARLMRLLSDDAARLTTGLPALGDTEAELGARPASLTVTFGFGPRVMREFTTSRGGQVEPIPPMATDALVPEWGQTDLVIQLCADDPLTLAHARRMLLKDSASFAKLSWTQHGFQRAYGVEPEGTTPRNIMGQVDGTVNPTEADDEFAGLVWSEAEDFAGGTFMVVRRIRAIMSTWDEVDRPTREAAVGRRLDTGAPLTGGDEFDTPDFDAVDAFGLPVIDPASHVARSQPQNPKQKFLRRPYNYTVPDPRIEHGEDSGLVFIAFAASLPEQFVPVQQRLAEADLLNEWTTAIGSAVYAIAPGAPEGQYVGQGLFG